MDDAQDVAEEAALEVIKRWLKVTDQFPPADRSHYSPLIIRTLMMGGRSTTELFKEVQRQQDKALFAVPLKPSGALKPNRKSAFYYWIRKHERNGLIERYDSLVHLTGLLQAWLCQECKKRGRLSLLEPIWTSDRAGDPAQTLVAKACPKCDSESEPSFPSGTSPDALKQWYRNANEAVNLRWHSS